MNKILLIYWPIGPTFKNRIKSNLKVFDSYKFFDVLILTDDIEYFDDLKSDNVNIGDLNAYRSLHPEFNEYENFPEEKRNSGLYNEQIKELVKQNKKFSIHIQRFSLLYENIKKYKFVSILDCDMIPVYTEDEFKTLESYLENTMPNNSLSTNRAYYKWDTEKNLSILKKYSQELDKNIEIEYPIENCDSLFKIYKFENPEKITEFFDTWNYVFLDSLKTKNHLISGSWNILIEELLAIVYKLIGIKINTSYADYVGVGGIKSYNFPEDRYWEDWSHGGFDTSAYNQEEFIEKNYDKLKIYYTNQVLKFPY